MAYSTIDRLFWVPEILKDIEEHVPVNDIVYRGLRVWPFLRILFAGDLYGKKQGGISAIPAQENDRDPCDDHAAAFDQLYQTVSSSILGLLGLKEDHHSDILFFSRGYEYLPYDEKDYNRHFSPIKEVLEEMGISHVDLIVPYDGKSREPKRFPVVNATKAIEFAEQTVALRWKMGPRPPIRNLSKLLNYISEKKISIPFDYEKCVHTLDRTLEYAAVFERLLKHIRPKAVFLTCFYNDILYGVILAARRLNIPSVEVERWFTQCGDLCVSNWTQVPEEGYELIPDYYWVWSEDSTPALDSWPRKSSHNLAPIVAGHLFMQRELKRVPISPRPAGKERVMLVTLEEMPHKNIANLIPEVVARAMEMAPDSWLWIFRQHFEMDAAHFEPIRDYMRKWGNKVKMEPVSECHLYSTLRMVDYHICQTISTGIEAEALGIPTIIVWPDPAKYYPKEIERGIFLHTTDPAELIRIISEKRKPNARGKRVIELDRNVARRALKQLIQTTSDDANAPAIEAGA